MHYPLGSDDMISWASAMASGSATLGKPPSAVWEVLQAQKSHILDTRKGYSSRRGMDRIAIGTSTNSMSHSPIVKVYVGKSSRKKHQLRRGESSSESSSESSRS